MKKIRIFSLPWHLSHQAELLKLPFEWTYLINHTRKWDERVRLMPEHLKWVPYYEDSKYDLAILHVDQQCLLPRLGKSILFREVFSIVKRKIPIIVINHGTPVYPELFIQMAEQDGYGNKEENGEAWARDKMKELLQGVDAVVVNSYEAQKQWGFGQTIIHGLDKEEWFDLRKEPRVVTFISPAGIGQKYYGRRLFNETREILKEEYGIESIWISEDFKPGNWNEYREFLGKSLVYFNPTIGLPMPRTRTEAMFSGCCIVTTRHQDADIFIKDGENGFICKDNPEDAAKKIAWCIEHYKESVEIGQKGKQTAYELFSGERFRSDWISLIEKTLKTKIV